jgi:hypothetical protein
MSAARGASAAVAASPRRALLGVLSLAASTRAASISFFSDARCGSVVANELTGAPESSAFVGACTDVDVFYPLQLSACAVGASATALVGAPSAGLDQGRCWFGMLAEILRPAVPRPRA